MYKYIIQLILLLGISTFCNAQFILNGKITYEKRVNFKLMYSNYNAEKDNSYYSSDYLKTFPNPYLCYYNLYFNDTEMTYVYEKEDDKYNDNFYYLINDVRNEDDKVYINMKKQEKIISRELLSNRYLIKDSLVKHQWTFHDELRTIAGYPCRKATTVIDSFVVVAFYTEQIVPNVGPEGISGLPGMVLGLAIPQMYTTWFATNVELVNVNASNLQPPTKGRSKTITELNNDISKSGKNDNNTWYLHLKILKL